MYVVELPNFDQPKQWEQTFSPMTDQSQIMWRSSANERLEYSGILNAMIDFRIWFIFIAQPLLNIFCFIFFSARSNYNF